MHYILIATIDQTKQSAFNKSW